jgi:glycosyltransferase involved in cell wall biosynthesis
MVMRTSAEAGLLILIPAYNESRTISRVIGGLKTSGYDVLVVDDGSTDETARLARESGAAVLLNEKNSGKGASLRRGFVYAVENRYGAVVTMDGDGQHAIESIVDFEKAWKSGCDVVLGCREFDFENMPRLRAVTNKSMSAVVTWFCKQRFRDTQCGYRLFSTRALKRLFVSDRIVTSTRYDFESEIIIEAHCHGFRVCEVVVPTIYNGAESSIRPFVDTVRFFRLILKELWRR